MKILLCIEDPRIPTGYGKICRQASENLTNHGHSIYSFAFNNTTPSVSVVNFKWGNVLSNLAMSRNKKSIYGDKELIQDAYKEFNIDSIIFCNDTHRFAYLKELPKEILSKSWFWHVCEADTQDWLGIDIFNKMKGVVFATKYAENFNKQYVKTQIDQIYPSVDLSVFKKLDKKQCRKELKIPDNIFTILRVDRNQPRKKWELTLRTFSQFKRQVPDAMLYCKCDPHDVSSSYNLVEMVEKLGIADHVRFDSRIIDDNELSKIYNSADIGFSTTSGEGFGFFQAEAIACGLPQIVTNSSACPEICGNVAKLIKIEKKELNTQTASEHNIIDVKDACQAITKLYNDWKNGGRIAKEMSDKSVQRAKEFFNPIDIWNKWNSILAKSSQETDVWTSSNVIINSPDIKLHKTEQQIEHARFILYSPDNINVTEWIKNAVQLIKSNENIGAVCYKKLNITELEDFTIGDFSLSIIKADIPANTKTIEDCIETSIKLAQNDLQIKFIDCQEPIPQIKIDNASRLTSIQKQYNKKSRENIKIVFHTEIGRGIGFSTIAEGLAPALSDLGFDVSINDWNNAKVAPDDVLSLSNKAKLKYQENPDWDDNAINVVCHLMETYDRVRKPYRIGFSFCESTKIRESYLTLCNGMNHILTFSDFCKNIQKLSGFQIPIHVLPPAIRPEYFTNKSNETDTFKFLHIGVSQERKRTQMLVESFIKTFPKEEKVELIIKSNDFGRLEWIDLYKDPRIKLIYTDKNPLSIDGIRNLFEKSNCYVQPSSGEGLGLPILESMAANKPIIYTDWSAPSEYLNDEIAYPLNIEKMVPAYTGAPQAYPGDNGEWALPNQEHLIKLMRHVYHYQDEAKQKALKAQEKAKKLTWLNTAQTLLPLLFKMEEERKSQNKISTFNPKEFVKPQIPIIKQDSKIEIDIATSNRHDYLSTLLMSLKNQIFLNWDLTLIVDDTDESILHDKLVIGLLTHLGNEGHRWRVIKGLRQGPHIAHQKTLSVAEHELICRIDDDIFLTPNYLQSLFHIMLADRNNEIAAVGGVYLNPFQSLEEQTFHPDCLRLDAFKGKINDRIMNLQIYHHPDQNIKDSEHLYSSFLYRKSCANAIGGYFMGYSRIGHREETDLTYRMFRSGWKLKVCPSAIAYHFSAPKGGIRMDNGAELAASDEKIFQKRLALWK